VIAGEGSRTHALQRALIVHGMAPWLDVPGRLSQALLRDLHGRADAFVTPADRESFGIAALEARAAGLRGAIAAHNRTVPVVFTWEATARLVDRAYAPSAAPSTGGELALQGPAADAGSPPRREGA
jgi:glycosyltransferase involved in cell wall biosynthesis